VTSAVLEGAGLEGALDQLRVGLEGLLSCLDARSVPEPAVVDGAWLHVQRGFERVREELSALDAEASREPFQARVEQCLQLYAVAAGLLARQRDVLAAERAVCSAARVRLRHVHTSSAGGQSCDLSG